jgi:7-cyano-7-deazaguanine synthase
MKHEIIKEGVDANVPYEHTWSCYGDGVYHCGKCGPCFMRKTAFERNGIKDPVLYETDIEKVIEK